MTRRNLGDYRRARGRFPRFCQVLSGLVEDASNLSALSFTLPWWSTYAAVAVSGLAGATYGAKRGFDVVGVFGLAFATGLGGLMLTDILLGNLTTNLLSTPYFLLVALAAAIMGFFFAGLISRFNSVMVILDGLAMGFLCTVGAQEGLMAGLPPTSAIFLGTLTAVGGLLLRDILAGDAPQIVRPGAFIAVPAIISSSVFVVMLESDLNPEAAQIVTMATALFLRAGAYWFGWQTGSANDLSARVWSFWSRKRDTEPDPVPDSFAEYYTDVIPTLPSEGSPPKDLSP